MTPLEPEQDQGLPDAILRPLIFAACGVGIFLLAFVAWAMFAPLATTITLSGRIVSSRPAFALQHPYGGLVAEVLVDRHDRVHRGDILMRLDSSIDAAALQAQTAMRDRLLTENAVIDALLAGGTPNEDTVPGLTASPHSLRYRQALLQQATSRETATSLRKQVTALNDKIDNARAQLALMSDRAARQAELLDQGLMRKTEGEQLEEQILIVKGEINADLASVFALENQIAQTLQQGNLAVLAVQQELRARRDQNLMRLDELRTSILDLQDKVARAEVRAPIDGTVTEVMLEAGGMFAGRGATLLTLAQPLERAEIAFAVPVSQIDQLHTGMTGRLIIPALPQRNMPRIDLRIDAISPRATTDEQGNPVSYNGRAALAQDSVAWLHEQLGSATLAADMPVMLTVAVRETTLADYIVTPFARAFGHALQD